jgi:hypothetical protein
MRILAIAAIACLAGSAHADFVENFNGGGAFPWTVMDYNGASNVVGWDYNYNIFDGVDARGNFSSGDGGAAHVDTDAASPNGPYDIAILSPETVISSNAFLSYNINFQAIGAFDVGHVEISTDGGATWDNLITYTDDIGGFPTFPYDGDEPLGVVETIDLAAYGGQSAIIQFRYEGDGWNWWMQVDDVSVVPAPATLALFGLGGLALRRRR